MKKTNTPGEQLVTVAQAQRWARRAEAKAQDAVARERAPGVIRELRNTANALASLARLIEKQY